MQLCGGKGCVDTYEEGFMKVMRQSILFAPSWSQPALILTKRS